MLALLLVLSMGAQPFTHEVATPADDIARRVAFAQSDDVTRRYNELLSKTKADRLHRYSEMSAALKSAMWTHQFLTALAEHPEFSAEQRALLEDAIRLFTPEMFDIPSSSPEWHSRVGLPARRFGLRAKAILGDHLAWQLFAQLGPANPTADTQAAGTMLRAAPKTDIPQCSCNTWDDFCPGEFGPDWYCLGGNCYFRRVGCGTLLLDSCVGLCDLKKFQDG